MKATLLSAAALATCALTAAPASAAITFTGSTTGCFGAACTAATTDTETNLGLTFNQGSFSTSTNSLGQAGISGNATTSLGSFTLGTSATNVVNDVFSLVVDFTAPPTSGQGSFFATLTGQVVAGPGGGVSINFTNPTQTIAYSGGSFTLSLSPTLFVQPGSTTYISGLIQAVPEPGTWAMMLLGFGAIGLTIRRRQRPALAQVA
jgi:hypothetical protein